MKLRILSDLHLELSSFAVPQAAADVVILAGDIHRPGTKAIHWARRESVFGTEVPILIVAGNHEFYGCSMDTELASMRAAAHGTNVHLLQQGEIHLGGVRFLGTTLWTDFLLPMKRPDGSLESNVERALKTANESLNDFRLIRVPFTVAHPRERPTMRRQTRHLTAQDTLGFHWQERSWLVQKLKEPFAGPTVVITHHAPARGSVNKKFNGHPLTPAFVSELGDALDSAWAPQLWIHGHTHDSSDYLVGRCRVLANPRGYLMKHGHFENDGFDPTMVVEVR